MYEDPDQARLRRGQSAFQSAIECKHGLAADKCSTCRDPSDWLASMTRRGTIRDVIAELKRAGLIDAIEEFDPRLRRGKIISARRILTAAGALFVGGIIVYQTVRQGKKLVLRLIRRETP